MKRFILLLVFHVLFFSLIGQNKNSVTISKLFEGIISLGNNREIFVDKYLLEKLEGTHLVLYQPVGQGPVFYFDQPCEGSVSGYVTVIKETDLYWQCA